MIDTIERHHISLNTIPRIILLSPPPIDQSLLSQHLPEQARLRSPNHTMSYANATLSLLLPSSVARIDLHEAIQLAAANSRKPTISSPNDDDGEPARGMSMGYEHYLSDGLHLKDTSYAIMYGLVKQAIDSRWPEIRPENMTMPVQWWGNIVPNHQRDEL
jgi:hypothetical protein